jgi:hypothetical protein
VNPYTPCSPHCTPQNDVDPLKIGKYVLIFGKNVQLFANIWQDIAAILQLFANFWQINVSLAQTRDFVKLAKL